MSTVAILGLGLIGGSLARDLAQRGHQVLGYDQARDVMRAALQSGVLSDALGPDLQGLERADAVVLAVPVNLAPHLLRSAMPRLHNAQLITDVGSTKRAICAQAAALGVGARFVGSHPFAGDHSSGWEASRTGLFQDARVFLCPVAETAVQVMERAHDLWQSVGGRAEVIDAELHDRRLAWCSHLPQLASSALALTLTEAGMPWADLGRGGRDVTRLAGSDPELWTGIVLENAANAAKTLATLEQQVARLRKMIEAGDEAGIRAALAGALRWSRAGAQGVPQ